MRLLLLAVALLALALPACLIRDDGGGACRSDLDCSAGVCAEGRCVECASNGDCGGDRFCCRGLCRAAADVDALCGCDPSPTGQPGESCTDVRPDALCLVDGSVATPATVSSGTCGCGCTPAEGGPLCTPPDGEDGAPVCACTGNEECRGGSLDEGGRPHRVANTCAPDARCVCLTGSGPAAPCDPDGAAPDCSFEGGCRALLDDAAHCGVSGRACTDPASGTGAGASCIEGGCTCDDAADCAGAALNVNTCAFAVAGEPARCVCGGYTKGGVQVACPMELECVQGGCLLDGVVHADEEALLGALGLRAP